MAHTLYAATGENFDTTSNLYTINTTTMVATSIGPIGYSLVGLAQDPTSSILYGLTSTNAPSASDPGWLITIDPTTGAGTPVASIQPIANDGAGANCGDICFDSTGQMWGTSDFDNGLVKINKATGAATNINPGALRGTDYAGGIDFNPNTGVCWLLGAKTFVYEMNTSTGVPTTGLHTELSTLPFAANNDSGNGTVASAKFNPDDGLLYYISYSYSSPFSPIGARLYKANTATNFGTNPGTDTIVGLIGGSLDWGAMAWVQAAAPPPPPTSASFVHIAFGFNTYDTSATFTPIQCQAVKIDRGRQYELDKTQAGTASVQIVDLNGDYDPTNPSSLYGSQVGPLLQAYISLVNPVDGSTHIPFTGFTESWTYAPDISGQWMVLTLALSDGFELLNRAEVVPDSTGTTTYAPQQVDDRMLAALADYNIGTPLAPAWQAHHNYSAGDIVQPTVSTGSVFQATQSGQSGGSEPTWPTKYGSANAVTDGGVEWVLGPPGASWPAEWTHINSGNTDMQETVYNPQTTILSVLQDAADAEFPNVANVFMDKWGRVSFTGRWVRFCPSYFGPRTDNQNPPGPNHRTATWNVGDHDAVNTHGYAGIQGIEWILDLKNIINACLCTPYSKSSALQAELEGQLRTAPASIDTYGPRALSVPDILVESSVPGVVTGSAQAPTWTSSTHFNAYDFVSPTSPSTTHPAIFYALAAGTTGGSEPTWPTSSEKTVVDGGVTWGVAAPGGDGANAPASDSDLTGLRECQAFGSYYIQNYASTVPMISQLNFVSTDLSAVNATQHWAFLTSVEISDVIVVNTTDVGGGGFKQTEFFVEGIHYVINPLDGGLLDVQLSLDLSPRAWYRKFPYWNGNNLVQVTYYQGS